MVTWGISFLVVDVCGTVHCTATPAVLGLVLFVGKALYCSVLYYTKQKPLLPNGTSVFFFFFFLRVFFLFCVFFLYFSSACFLFSSINLYKAKILLQIAISAQEPRVSE